MKLGYACINMTLADQKIRANRTMIRRTFDTKGLDYVSELALQNVEDLEKIIDWNIENDIYAYRMPDDIFPWKSEYEYEQLKDFDSIQKILIRIGEKCRKYNHRLSFHPGPYNVLASPKENVVENTIRELNQFSKMFDLMLFDATPNTKINIHVGGAYGDKKEAMQRFCDNFPKLDSNTQKRLTVENDDKDSLYTVQDLMFIHNQIKIPIVFDYHHFTLKNDGHPYKETLELAISTWPTNIIPVVHMSSSKDVYETPDNKKKNLRSHADYIYEKLNTFDKEIVIILESKAKELSLLKYRKDFI